VTVLKADQQMPPERPGVGRSRHRCSVRGCR